MKSSLFALLSAAAVFSGADAAGLRSLISSRSRHSVKYPCNPNPHGNALVCKDGSRAFEACSRGHGQAKFYCKRDWNVCGKKDPHTKTWEHRQYCPVGRFQCENGFCSEDAAGCKHFPVKYGSEACPRALKCPQPPPPQWGCTSEHAPVCADGKTFSNRCEAEKAGYLGGCSSKIAEGVCARNCGDDEHSITDLACRAGKTVAEFCFENFPSQHVCDNSDLLEAFDSASKLTCSAPECAAHKGYICPANSAPAELYAHPRSFDDCSCDSGFAKHGDMCARQPLPCNPNHLDKIVCADGSLVGPTAWRSCQGGHPRTSRKFCAKGYFQCNNNLCWKPKQSQREKGFCYKFGGGLKYGPRAC